MSLQGTTDLHSGVVRGASGLWPGRHPKNSKDTIYVVIPYGYPSETYTSASDRIVHDNIIFKLSK